MRIGLLVFAVTVVVFAPVVSAESGPACVTTWMPDPSDPMRNIVPQADPNCVKDVVQGLLERLAPPAA